MLKIIGYEKIANGKKRYRKKDIGSILFYLCCMTTIEERNKTILSNLNIVSLNEMQIAVHDTIMNQQNTLLLSPTGSGKTLGFLLPILNLLDREIKAIQCLVIVPSRELALQIEQVWKRMGTKFKVNVCYGGHSIDTEINNLKDPPALLIGTPGRLVDHLTRQSFDAERIKILVLDEFDKSLQLGFQEDMSTIIDQLPSLQKRILLSATSDIEFPVFFQMKSPVILDYTQVITNDAFSIKLVISQEKDKIESLFRLICSFNSEPAIVFCNHREAVERISNLLNKKGIYSGYYHGGMDQDDRERILIQFRNRSLNYLITTDLAARGLDIPDMKHVIHYHLPANESEFTHRNGRTARMHASGTAYVLSYEEDELPKYLSGSLDILQIKSANKLPDSPAYKTIYISGGKKNKLNKTDIVGFFLQKGKLDKLDLGLIEVKDFVSFVAIRSPKIKTLLNNIKDEKMKGKKYKIEVARSL